MAEIIYKNAMCVVNCLQEKCDGVITRIRSTDDGNVERSAIGLVLVSADMVDSSASLKIDEQRKIVLIKITKNKKGEVKVQESNHNVIEKI